MCVNPILIQNKKYVPNKANGGKPPDCKDNRLRVIEVPCGRCHQCRIRKGTNWTNRITEELRHNNGIFVTLSISNEAFDEIQSKVGTCNSEIVAKYAIKQWREKCRKNSKSPRYWMITELGQKSTLSRMYFGGATFFPSALTMRSNFFPFLRMHTSFPVLLQIGRSLRTSSLLL
jgi:hypothetical protein